MEIENNHDDLVAHLGSNVLIDINNGDRLTFARLHASATLKIGNTRCLLAPLIGSPYGSVFELQTGPKGPFLVRIPPDKDTHVIIDQNQEESTAELGNIDAEITQRDNRSLVDDNTAQKLSANDISRMRRECLSGKEIVDALVANSTTFQNKTVYSQEKYKRKKQKKYAPCLVVRRPSARRICEAYFMKSPQKIGFLRMDTLGLMLSLANIGAHAEVLVLDTVGGLLTAAVAERIGGFGSVCSVYHTDKPPSMDIVGLLNLSDTMASRVFRAFIWEVSAAFKKNRSSSDIATSADMTHAICKSCNNSVSMEAEPNVLSVPCSVEPEAVPSIEDGFEVCVEETVVATCDHKDRKSTAANANGSIRPWRYASAVDVSVWATYGFSSLLVGAPEIEPWNILQELLPLLCSSSPFVIYHQYLQPLVECMHQLQANRMAVALEILEPWLREYQVLPSRTHPHMQMNSNGGFVLTGIKVATL